MDLESVVIQTGSRKAGVGSEQDQDLEEAEMGRVGRRRKSWSVRGMEALLSWGISLWVLAPDWVLAAGEKATNLVVVADTRRLSGIMKYFANLYNTNTLLFAIWAVVLTALWGGILGFLMDFIMARTGLDLKSRKIVEH